MLPRLEKRIMFVLFVCKERTGNIFTTQTSLLKIGRLLHKSGFVDSQLLPTVVERTDESNQNG